MTRRQVVSRVDTEERTTADADLGRLLDAAFVDLVARYGSQRRRSVHPDARFLVAVVDGHAVGCGAIQPLDRSTGELRRMFVRADHRGRGVARALLAALEELGGALGYATVRLGTGIRQPEAVALYESCGYARIERYGGYLHGPWGLCYEKRLDGPGGRAAAGPWGA